MLFLSLRYFFFFMLILSVCLSAWPCCYYFFHATTDLRTQRDYAPDYHTIPSHGRWQHFEIGGRPRVDQMMASWPSNVDTAEQTRRLIDLFLVSVLLDAGAGNRWQYKARDNGKFYRRSEGLAVASMDMFKDGLFSSNPGQKEQVDGETFTLFLCFMQFPNSSYYGPSLFSY